MENIKDKTDTVHQEPVNVIESEEMKKKAMTHEERIELAAKLDKELEEFIEKLPKRKQPEGEPDENWIEEFEKHPFFMKKVPEPGEEVHPLYEGLQKLKYDPEENTPIELATSYKEDGNFNFKHKNYRLAILGYTEGIKVRCGDPEVESSLYNNRAAANWFLKNYRSCLNDCETALKFKPDYDKVIIRAANACFQMAKFDKAIEFCDKILEKISDQKEMLELRRKCVNEIKSKERDVRKRALAAKKMKMEEEMIVEEISKRGIKIEEKKHLLKLEMLEPRFPELASNRVYLNSEKELVWPVVFLYPEFQIMDFVQQFCETDTFADQINRLFGEIPEWDKTGKYRANEVNIYYENDKGTKIKKVDLEKTLLEVLKDDDYVIKGGTPSFIIFVKNSLPEQNFLNKY